MPSRPTRPYGHAANDASPFRDHSRVSSRWGFTLCAGAGVTTTASDRLLSIVHPIPSIPWSLEDWLRYSIHLMEADRIECHLGDRLLSKVELFLHLRYTRMGALFPHEPFSVNEATPAFFRDTLDYLVGVVALPERRPGVKAEDAKHDLYWRRYREWVLSHRRRAV